MYIMQNRWKYSSCRLYIVSTILSDDQLLLWNLISVTLLSSPLSKNTSVLKVSDSLKDLLLAVLIIKNNILYHIH